MKKILISSFVLLTILSMISCASTARVTTPPAAPEQPAEPTPPPPPPTPNESQSQYTNGLILDGAKFYTVVRGDTLSQIANREWNKQGYYFPVIVLASRSTESINDPDLIEPGMKLTIPDLQKNLADPTARATIKSTVRAAAEIYRLKYIAENGAEKKSRHEKLRSELTKLSDSL